MRARRVGRRWFRWARALVGSGEAPDTTVNAAQSSFVLSAYEVDADETEVDFTTTARNAAGTALEGKAVSVVAEDVFVDADASTFDCVETEIEDDGADVANLRLVLLDDDTGAPIPDVLAADVVVSSSRGATDTITAVDTRSDANGLLRYTVVSSTAGDPVFTAVVHGLTITETCTVEVTDTPTGVTFDFQSNWSTATGSTSNAVTDGGAWDTLVCSSYANVGTVVEQSTVGFTSQTGITTTNVLRIQKHSEDNCMTIQKSDAVTIGTTNYGRFWFRNDGNWNKVGVHPTGYHVAHGADTIQAIPWGIDTRVAEVGSGHFRILMATTSAGYPYQQWFSPILDDATWYRFEWQLEHIDSTHYRIYPRIYSAGGTLLYDYTNYQQQDAGAVYLDDYYAFDSGTRAFVYGDDPGGGDVDLELARNFGIGNEGPSGATDSGTYFYYAEFGMSTDGWIGDAT